MSDFEDKVRDAWRKQIEVDPEVKNAVELMNQKLKERDEKSAVFAKEFEDSLFNMGMIFVKETEDKGIAREIAFVRMDKMYKEMMNRLKRKPEILQHLQYEGILRHIDMATLRVKEAFRATDI